MIGAGIFTVLALTVRAAGPGAVLAWVLVVLLSLPMAFTFSDLTCALAESGGPYVYIRDRTFRFLCLFVAWSFLVSAVGAAAALFMALIRMVQELGIPYPFAMSCILLFAVSVALSRGVYMGARIQRWLTIGTVLLLVMCIIIGLTHALWLPDKPLGAPTRQFLAEHRPWRALVLLRRTILPHGFAAVLLATFYAFWSYSGWEAVAVPSDAYRSRRVLARGMMIGSIFVGVLYILVALSAVLSLHSLKIGAMANPLVDLGRLWNPFMAEIVGFGAIVVVVSSLLAWLLAAATLVQSAARDGLFPLPKSMYKERKEYHPLVPVLLAIALMVLGKLPMFTAMIAVSSQTALIAYGIVFAAVALDRQEAWQGVIRTSALRRLSACLAFLTTVLLVMFSGWSNLWPTLVVLALGGVLVWRESRQRRAQTGSGSTQLGA